MDSHKDDGFLEKVRRKVAKPGKTPVRLPQKDFAIDLFRTLQVLDDRMWTRSLSWWNHVVSLVDGKWELAVAEALYDLALRNKGRSFTLFSDWKRDYAIPQKEWERALVKLERKGLITVERRGKGTFQGVTLTSMRGPNHEH